jgi:hypothetical protein
MLTVSLIDELLQRLLAGMAVALLRILGGPDRLPNRNDDFVWF